MTKSMGRDDEVYMYFKTFGTLTHPIGPMLKNVGLERKQLRKIRVVAG